MGIGSAGISLTPRKTPKLTVGEIFGSQKIAMEDSIEEPAPEEMEAGEEQAEESGYPLSGKVLELVNAQYNKEEFSSQTYYALSAYFADIKLEGFAQYFRKAAVEEHDHAMKFFDYMIKCNVLIKPIPMDAPKTDFESPKAACNFFLKHEQEVTRLINSIADAAMTAKDFYTFGFINWFLSEQLEEVRKAEDLSKKMELVADDAGSLLLVDMEMKED